MLIIYQQATDTLCFTLKRVGRREKFVFFCNFKPYFDSTAAKDILSDNVALLIPFIFLSYSNSFTPIKVNQVFHRSFTTAPHLIIT